MHGIRYDLVLGLAVDVLSQLSLLLLVLADLLHRPHVHREVGMPSCTR